MKNLFLLAAGLFLTSSVFAWKVIPLKTGTTSSMKIEIDVNQTSSQADILFVVDNSGSMTVYQQTLVNNINSLIGGLVKYDVHAAVVTADMESNAMSGKFVTGVMKSSDVDFTSKLYQSIIGVGENGWAFEELFSPVLAALTPPLSLNENKDFLRENANLIVVYLTDAEDQSTISAVDFVNSLKAIKAHSNGTVSLVAMYAPSTGQCKLDSDKPFKFEAALTSLNAKMIAICDPNLSKGLAKIGDSLVSEMVSLDRKIKLPLVPELNTLKVTFGSIQLAGGDLQHGWTYDAQSSTLFIGDLFDFKSQPTGTKLVIEYVVEDKL